ncbi:uncharacterized protein [Ambystoma mexicanum]|uniref:uncharacterized protein n=1 Tax=Ambystoma mexicanum TaxID=8296 RepID=UPI0037E9A106
MLKMEMQAQNGTLLEMTKEIALCDSSLVGLVTATNTNKTKPLRDLNLEMVKQCLDITSIQQSLKEKIQMEKQNNERLGKVLSLWKGNWKINPTEGNREKTREYSLDDSPLSDSVLEEFRRMANAVEGELDIGEGVQETQPEKAKVKQTETHQDWQYPNDQTSRGRRKTRKRLARRERSMIVLPKTKKSQQKKLKEPKSSRKAKERSNSQINLKQSAKSDELDSQISDTGKLQTHLGKSKTNQEKRTVKQNKKTSQMFKKGNCNKPEEAAAITKASIGLQTENKVEEGNDSRKKNEESSMKYLPTQGKQQTKKELLGDPQRNADIKAIKWAPIFLKKEDLQSAKKSNCSVCIATGPDTHNIKIAPIFEKKSQKIGKEPSDVSKNSIIALSSNKTKINAITNDNIRNREGKSVKLNSPGKRDDTSLKTQSVSKTSEYINQDNLKKMLPSKQSG